jgi:hypothetical protein
MKTFNLKVILQISLILFLVLGTGNLKAQHVQISVNYNQGVQYNNNWGLFNGGVELSADYIFGQNNWLFNSGINFRTIQWGNQASISLGIVRTLGRHVELGTEIQNGLALFYPQSLYVFAMGATCNITLIQKEKMSLGLSLEARYSICPEYENYGLIYHVTEIPIGIYVRF